jgi:hypothetical protein
LAGAAAAAGLAAGAEGLAGALDVLFFCADTHSGVTITENSKNATVARYLKLRVGFT